MARRVPARTTAMAVLVCCLLGFGSSIPTWAANCDYARAPYSVRTLPFIGGVFSPAADEMAFNDRGAIKIYDVATDTVVRQLSPGGERGVAQVLAWTTNDEIYFTRGGVVGSGPSDGGLPSDPNRTAFGDIYVVRADGVDERRVTVERPLEGPMLQYGQPKVSPDGTKVAYTFVADVANSANGKPLHSWHLAIADIVRETDGSVRFAVPNLLTDDPYYYEAKEWSGDSTKLVFASTRGEDRDRRALNSDVYVIDRDSKAIARLTSTPTWEEAADLLRGDLGPEDAMTFISDRDTPNPMTHPYYSLSDLLPNAADSALVALSVPALALWTSHEIFVAGPDGDHGWVRRLTFDYRSDLDGWVGRVPVWSPDGTMIRFGQWRSHGATALGQRERLLVFQCGAN